MQRRRRILLVAIGGLGDFINIAPSIRLLRLAFPDDYLALLVTDRCVSYAIRCPDVNQVYAFPALPFRKSGGWLKSFANYGEAFGVAKKLRAERFDTLVNFMKLGSPAGARKMRWLSGFLGVGERLGRDSMGLGSFYTKSIQDSKDQRTTDAAQFLEVAKLLGRPLSEPKAPELWIRRQEEALAEELLKSLQIGRRKPVVLIHPGSDRVTRLWFAERYAEVARELIQTDGATVALVGGESERQLAARIEELARPAAVANLVGKTTIGSLAALMKRVELVFCNYSMALHLAAACGAPTVGICASGDPEKDKPFWMHERVAILWKPIECSPCYFWSCPQPDFMKCMRQITVEDALAAARRLLSAKAAEKR